jgi:integral membrane protein
MPVRSIQLLRKIGFAEGVSFLLLLFIAMPLKYFMGLPEAVKFAGWAHGILFVAYSAAVLYVRETCNWSLLNCFIAFAAGLFPFGTFILDRRLKKETIVAEELTIQNNK